MHYGIMRQRTSKNATEFIFCWPSIAELGRGWYTFIRLTQRLGNLQMSSKLLQIKLFGTALIEGIKGPTQDQVSVSIRPSVGMQAKVSYVGKFTHSL